MDPGIAAFAAAAAVFAAVGALVIGMLLVWLRDDIRRMENRTDEQFAALEKRIDARFARLETRTVAIEHGRARQAAE